MIGEHIRALREANDILLRQLATKLDMDQAMLSKMERGERAFRKEDIDTLTKIFKQPKKELLMLWLADKILKTTENERYKKEALIKAMGQIN
jgi:transcriptional regulator with XRE-family HTH domain